eukprot:jgi/Botrbrau1/2282/Bobra.101_2s0105.1
MGLNERWAAQTVWNFKHFLDIPAIRSGVLAQWQRFSVLLFDIAAAAVLLAVALLGAYLPVILSGTGSHNGAPPTRNLAYVLGNMLSAGVMVSAGFVHLLGTAIKELDPMERFPLAPFLCGTGFILTLLADRLAESLSRHTGLADFSACGSGADDHLDHEGALLRSVVVASTPAFLLAQALEEKTELWKGVWSHEEIASSSALPPVGPAGERRGEPNGVSPSLLQRTNSRGRLKALEVADAESPRVSDGRSLGTGQSIFPPTREEEAGFVVGSYLDSAAGDGEESESKAGPSGRRSWPRAWRFPSSRPHSWPWPSAFTPCWRALPWGAQINILDTLHIFIAIVAHKGLAAYALGSSVVDSRADKRKFWIVIACFSAATPVGIFVGYMLQGVAQNERRSRCQCPRLWYISVCGIYGGHPKRDGNAAPQEPEAFHAGAGLFCHVLAGRLGLMPGPRCTSAVRLSSSSAPSDELLLDADPLFLSLSNLRCT